MDRSLEKLLGECVTGARKACTLADDLETMFEMWVGYFIDRVGERTFFSRMQTFDDRTFNLDGYQPTIMPAPINLIEGMTSIGCDIIKPSPGSYDEDVDVMLVEEAMSSVWLLFTVTEQGHPLKGLR